MLKIKTVNKAIQSTVTPNMELVQGEGYMYLVYDNGSIYETKSIMVPRLNDLILDDYLEEAESFFKAILK